VAPTHIHAMARGTDRPPLTRLVRAAKQPTSMSSTEVRILSAEATRIRRNYGTLFGARAFRELVRGRVDFATREDAR